jgi:hypothetical protein
MEVVGMGGVRTQVVEMPLAARALGQVWILGLAGVLQVGVGAAADP